MKLVDYAAKTARHCPVCELSPAIRQEIHDGWAQGIRAAAIIAWLIAEKNIPENSISLDNVRHHLVHEARRNAKASR